MLDFFKSLFIFFIFFSVNELATVISGSRSVTTTEESLPNQLATVISGSRSVTTTEESLPFLKKSKKIFPKDITNR